jgi:hypothetical protein
VLAGPPVGGSFIALCGGALHYVGNEFPTDLLFDPQRAPSRGLLIQVNRKPRHAQAGIAPHQFLTFVEQGC